MAKMAKMVKKVDPPKWASECPGSVILVQYDDLTTLRIWCPSHILYH
jgi:hypothetical protein